MHRRLSAVLLSMDLLTAVASTFSFFGFFFCKEISLAKTRKTFSAFCFLKQKRQKILQGQLKVTPFARSHCQIDSSGAQECSCKCSLCEMQRSEEAL